MSFKNALKNLVAHFGIVWALLLYIILFAAVIAGISLPFVLPIARAFGDAGVFAHISDAFAAIFGEGGLQGMWEGFMAAYTAVMGVMQKDSGLLSLAMYFTIFIVIIAFRFFLGLYEIPMTTVMDGRLSCDAHYGFGGKFVSTLPLAIKYSFFKMLYTTLYDTVIGAIMYGIGTAMGSSLLLPFVAILVLLIFGSFRFSLVACWAPCVVNGDRGVIKGFARSAKICCKNFGTFYSTYCVSLMLIFAIGAFIAIFTLGVGLIIVLPFAASYISYLNITEYYNKTGKRYYVDGIVFTPPAASDLLSGYND